MTEKLWGPRDLAEFLGVPIRTVYAWRSRGEGPRGYRVGKYVRYRREDVEEWLRTVRDRKDRRRWAT